MFEELYYLLSQLGLGAAARPLCNLLASLAGESMTVRQLQQEIRTVLHLYGSDDRAGEVISALVELGFAGLSAPNTAENETVGAAARPGCSAIGDSVVLGGAVESLLIGRRAPREIHETARGWLDIDGGIYFDVRQHGEGSDSER
jgi:hypothetical protein